MTVVAAAVVAVVLLRPGTEPYVAAAAEPSELDCRGKISEGYYRPVDFVHVGAAVGVSAVLDRIVDPRDHLELPF